MNPSKLFILFTLFSFSVAAKQSVDLNAMTESEKNKTGLYKLTDSELKALQNWLESTQQQVAQVKKEQNAGFEFKQQSDRSTIHTTLEKQYKDPLGNTFYKLTNGQVWKQTQSGRITVKGDNQSITIEPKMMGSWMLKGDGNRGVKVKRIR